MWVGTEGGLQRLEGGRFSPKAVPKPPAAVNVIVEDGGDTEWDAANVMLY